MLGALLALASAATFGFNNAALRRGVLTGSVLQAMAITVPMGVPLFALVCIPFGGYAALEMLPASGWLWMALAGVVHFIIGRYGNYRTTQALGANLSGPVQQLSIPISVVLAMIFLGETITPVKLLGFIMVMFGPAIMMRRRDGDAPRRSKSGFEPRYREGLFWGMVCSLGYGVSPLLIVKGLGPDGGLKESLAGGLISYTVATMVILILISLSGGIGMMRSLDRTAGKWFLVSGVFVFLSQMFRYMSHALAPVSIVVPIQRLSAVFRVVFSWMMNRDHEIFDFWSMLGIAVSVAGAIALTLSTDFVAGLLPPAWEDFLRIEWP
jgi:drug/metabolite transporter (DMT)-like permease